MLARHPLEPLDADEIRAASAILRVAGHLREGVRVIGLTLHEPTRDDLRRLAAGQALDRAVFAVLLDTSSGETEEVIVSLTEGRIVSSRRLRDVQPPIVYGELRPAEQAAREHPDWQAAMRRRGITDFSLCMLDLWPAGNFGTDKPGQRLYSGRPTCSQSRSSITSLSRAVRPTIAFRNDGLTNRTRSPVSGWTRTIGCSVSISRRRTLSSEHRA
jgi:Cu2+-containing amine oxidase